MAKVLVLSKTGEVNAEETGKRLVAEFDRMYQEFVPVVGVSKNDKGDEFPTNTYKVHPDIKAEILRRAGFIAKILQADKAQSNVGPGSKADLVALRPIWLKKMRENPNLPKETLNLIVANEYNETVSDMNDWISTSYVGRVAKANNWQELLSIPEPEEVNA